MIYNLILIIKISVFFGTVETSFQMKIKFQISLGIFLGADQKWRSAKNIFEGKYIFLPFLHDVLETLSL